MDNKSTGESKELVEFQEKNLISANERIKELEKENAELRKLVIKQKNAPIKSTEELLCELEIEKLNEQANTRFLTINETKQFDMYVKNLYMIRGKEKKDPKDVPNEELDVDTLVKHALLPSETK